ALRGDTARPGGADGAATLVELDAALVRALGLRAEAAAFTKGARRAGLAPPDRFGTEVVVRLLGLRENHPAGEDELERHPRDVATRAQAAYSFARLLELQPSELEQVRTEAAAFALPVLSPWQRRILRTAVGLVGYPYVWGGSSEQAAATAAGGFDCSGFVWRVYKLQRYPASARLPRMLQGRTTYTMSAESARSTRVPYRQLAPADVVFFGAAGPSSKPAQIDHMGIYLGNGWLVHSSRNGVALTPLTGWYRERYAWARRPLAEARLEPVGEVTGGGGLVPVLP
ncbi:MAG: C40 family peptidase, partial [Actinobacteria bacterium]|nr:C40 family peptidase [Actinomycetota bacterium]